MSKLLIVFGIIFGCLQAGVNGQDKAYVKVVNLIDTGEPTIMSLDGYTFRRGQPVPVGFASGALGLSPGPHSIKVKNSGADRGELNISLDLVTGTTYGLVCFCEIEQGKDKDGKRVEVHKMKYTVLSGNDNTNQAKLTIFSLAQSEVVEVRIKGRPYRIAQKIPVKVDVNVGEVVDVIDMKDNDIGGVEIISDFHYVGFIDDNGSDGGLRFTFFEQRSYAGGDIVIQEEAEEEVKDEADEESSDLEPVKADEVTGRD